MISQFFSFRAKSVNTWENSSALSSPTQSSSVALGFPDEGVVLLLCYYEDQSVTHTGRSQIWQVNTVCLTSLERKTKDARLLWALKSLCKLQRLLSRLQVQLEHRRLDISRLSILKIGIRAVKSWSGLCWATAMLSAAFEWKSYNWSAASVCQTVGEPNTTVWEGEMIYTVFPCVPIKLHLCLRLAKRLLLSPLVPVWLRK